LKFIKRIFGKKEDIPKEISIKIDDLSVWIETESQKQFSVLRSDIKQKYDEISATLENLSTSRDHLKDAKFGEKTYKRLAKAGTSNRDNLIKNINVLIERTIIPEDIDPSKAVEFYIDMKSTLKTCLDNTTRSQEYVKLIFPEGYKVVVIDLKRLDTLLDELMYFIEGVKDELDVYTKLPEDIEIINQSRHQIKEMTDNIPQLEAKYESLKNNLHTGEDRLAEMERSEEIIKANELEKQIKTLNDRISGINSNVKELFAPLSKALLRMQKQHESGRHTLSSINSNNLRTLIEDPALILGNDINSFLNEIRKSVEDGTLGLKQQKANKTTEQIDRLTGSDILLSMYRDRESDSAKLTGLLEERNRLTVYKERTRLEKKLSDYRSSINSIEQSLDIERKDLDSLIEEVEQLKTKLNSDLSFVFNKDIKIVY
jgi:predicted  nucleic acid-binding Zn-ribbon protein